MQEHVLNLNLSLSLFSAYPNTKYKSKVKEVGIVL